MYAEVLVDIPIQEVNRRYVYRVPVELEPTLEVGRRVLVPFGNRRCEGYVAALIPHTEVPNPKAILRVLDEQTVVTSELLELAEWIAAYYLCPVSLVLRTMVPRSLKKRRQKMVAPLLSEEEGQEVLQLFSGRPAAADLMARLWDEGEMTWRRARSLLGDDQLAEEMEAAGLIVRCGTYKPVSYTLDNQVYSLNDKSQAMEALQNMGRRAPRQAEALQILLENSPISAIELEQKIPRSSLNALIKKDLITKRIQVGGGGEEPFHPTAYQEAAIKDIGNLLRSERMGKCLLFGVTGSGKTEVYLQAVDLAISMGKQVIVLVPEIALTQQMVSIFVKRLGERMAVLHSRLSDSERYEEWKRIRNSEVDLVLGPRSAIFSPFTNLGLIILDEEQEYTYKQEAVPRYHAREVAEKRAELQDAVVVLGSATPSVETFRRALNGEYLICELPKRIGRHPLPDITVVDLREEFKSGNRGILSRVLSDKLEGCLNRGEQAIIFLNRRGYSTFVMCRECGLSLECPHCAIPLTYHQVTGRLHCHYCFYEMQFPQLCPGCQGKYLRRLGLGTQQVEEVIKASFPQARVRRMDIDTTRRKGSHQEIIQGMNEQQIDILIGTQMVAKGFDFPQVSLVGVISADTLLNLPDFRAYERGFQLLLQVAGRAGRAEVPGEVVFQTYEPYSHAIIHARNHDYLSFYREEIKFREMMDYPPFSHLVRIVVSSPLQRETVLVAQEIGQLAEDLLVSHEEGGQVLGPGPCPWPKLRDRYRYQLMLRGNNLILLNSVGRYIIKQRKTKNVKIDVDVNPLITM